MDGRIWQKIGMKTKLTLRPGDRGIRKRIKTAEIIVDEAECAPAKEDLNPHDSLPVEVGCPEKKLRERVKMVGKRRHYGLQGWILPRPSDVHPGLQHRLLTEKPLEAEVGSHQI